MNNEWKLTETNGLRPGQITAVQTFRDYLLSGKTEPFSIIMPCRYGKSDTIRNLAITGLELQKISGALAVHPVPYLAQQLLEPSRMLAWRRRVLPQGPSLSKVQTLPDFAINSMCNGEWLGSIHIQALIQPMQRHLLKEWIKKKLHETGLPPLIQFDESQRFALSNTWGSVAREVHALGAYVAVMSATPFRNDEDDVFGYKKENPSEVATKTLKYATAYGPDSTKLVLHTKQVEQREWKVGADVDITFAQAFMEGAIAKITFEKIDVKMKGYGEGKEGKDIMLSELSEEDARKSLPKIYRDAEVINSFASKIVKTLELYKNAGVPQPKAIIYGMNDDENGEANNNQKAMQTAINTIAPCLIVKIATLANDETSDGKASEILTKYCDNQKGSADIVLLKQMGDIGLDSDNTCVVGMFNTCRSLTSMIQQAMRGGNPKLKNHFTVVTLADVITERKLESFITGEGGVYTEVNETDHTMELIDKQEAVLGGYMPDGISDSEGYDSDGLTANESQMRLALKVLAVWPALITMRTLPQLAQDAERFGLAKETEESEPQFLDTTKIIEAYAENLNRTRDQIARVRFRKKNNRGPNTPQEVAEFGPLKEQIVKQIKARCGVFKSWNQKSKERSQDLKDYKRWQYAADAVLAEEKA